ncbi:MAG TPA: 50S ribosomal protein L11 methyltransferase, partial [Chitinophagales bacterium]|nr:50S ribosomal protein L11 methyltransferase [Chitinophagales bacterium]
QCNLIKPLLGSIEEVMHKNYDIILANIHKNFHLEHLKQYAIMMNEGAYILLSGFYASDSREILDKALECNLIANYSSVRDNWAMIILYKN